MDCEASLANVTLEILKSRSRVSAVRTDRFTHVLKKTGKLGAIQ